ncbi:MAG: hypothetical protein NC548_58525, partial [Lachnospiraceae bacterium]|nr:hypothetical protein [Lachnospiraceae bacterium]
SLLLYKDARVDQRILDETFGSFGWKRSHQSIDGNLYCTVEIRDGATGEWIAKQDVGTTGQAEKEKSQASDSFKRACFNWGIGRELYSAPFIWIPATEAEVYRRNEKEERYYCNEHFSVSSITYNDAREIDTLTITDGRGRTVFAWKRKPCGQAGQAESGAQEAAGKTKSGSHEKTAGRTKSGRQEKAAGKTEKLTKKQMDTLEAELQRTGVDMDAVKERYHVKKPEQMTDALYERVMNALAKTKSADAA